MASSYGHIFNCEKGEIDFVDVLKNKKILVVVLPSLEKSPIEQANLGKLILSGIRLAAATGLGGQPIAGPHEAPFLNIVDEYAAIVTPGFEQLLTQGRSLGLATVVASQDLAGIQKADEKAAQQIVANTNIKIFMKTLDPQTFDLLDRLAGKEWTGQVKGYAPVDLIGQTASKNTSLVETSRVHQRDLQEQGPGEAHIFHNGNLIRANMYYANPDISDVVFNIPPLPEPPAAKPEAGEDPPDIVACLLPPSEN